MTDREALAYIKGLIELSSIDMDLHYTIIEAIDKQLTTSGNITIPNITTGTEHVPYNPDWTVTCTDVLGPNYGG